ncbi:MAG: hypothetical protein GY820_05545 [Gammaproteobacteria bacterium]|nr:hypothetical protein [Gammaproteobacteria bacterium]
MNEKLYKMPENCDFMKISNLEAGENECTPVLLDPMFSEFTGLLINGPKQVVWPADVSVSDYPPGPFGDTHGPLRLMIAGLANVEYSTLGLKGDVSSNVLVVAVNQLTAGSYTGKMPEPEFLPEPAFGINEGSIEEPVQEGVAGSWFNLDLVHDLSLPITEASYTVYATLGDYKSNILTIKTVVK